MNNYNASPRASVNKVSYIFGGLAGLFSLGGCAQYDTNADARFKDLPTLNSSSEEERKLEKDYVASLATKLGARELFTDDKTFGDGLVFIVYDTPTKEKREEALRLNQKGIVLGEAPDLDEVKIKAKAYRTLETALNNSEKTVDEGRDIDFEFAPVKSAPTATARTSYKFTVVPKEYARNPAYDDEDLIAVIDVKEQKVKCYLTLQNAVILQSPGNLDTGLSDEGNLLDQNLFAKARYLHGKMRDLGLTKKELVDLPLSVSYDIQFDVSKKSIEEAIGFLNTDAINLTDLATLRSEEVTHELFKITWEPIKDRKPNERPRDFNKDAWVKLYFDAKSKKIKAKLEERIVN